MDTQGTSSTPTFNYSASILEQKESRKGFGKFHVQAAGIITLKLTKRIATYFGFSDSDVSILNDNDDPGLELLYMMRTRGLITSIDISKLVQCLEEIESGGTAKEIQSSFDKNGCRNVFSSHETETLQEESRWEDSHSSEEAASCMGGATPETESSLQSSRKRKIDSAPDQYRRVGKQSSRRLSPCSESRIIYVLKYREHGYTSQEGNKRVIKNEEELGRKDRKCQYDKVGDQDEEKSHERRGSDNDERENDDKSDRKQGQIKRRGNKHNKERDCSKDDTPGNKKSCIAEVEDEEDEKGILVAAVLEGKSQEVKMLYTTRDRLKTNFGEGKIYNIRDHWENQDSILLTTTTKLMRSAEDEAFQNITNEMRNRAITSLSNSNLVIEIPGVHVKKVKYGIPGKTPVNSLKAIVTKIVLHVDYSQYTNSFEKKAILTVADSERDRLTVIAHDKHVSTSKLREGSIIKLLKFGTYRGSNYADSNCLVSRMGSEVKLINHEGLQKLQVLLPLTDSYQMEGKLIGINVDLNTYNACPRAQCHEKKVEAAQKGHFYCKKCGETYKEEKIVEGFFLELSVADGNKTNYIIFKSTMASTLQELHENTSKYNKELTEMFENCFFSKMIRMVVKPSEGQSKDVITSIQALI